MKTIQKEMNSYNTVIICHGGCMDGTASAWIVREMLRSKGHDNTRYIFGMKRDLDKDLASSGWKDFVNGIEYPTISISDLQDKDVFILDYMYPIESIKRIPYKTLTIIDHHRSNKDIIEKCKSLDTPLAPVRVYYDEEHSAAGLAWKVLMQERGDAPWWIQYIEDRDLFRFSLKHSREINDAMFNLKYRTFNKFDELHRFSTEEKNRFIEQGTIIGSIKHETINNIVRHAYLCMLDEYKVYVVQSGILVSDVSEVLYTTYSTSCDFVMCIYYDFKERGFKCRMRCKKESPLDLSSIAKRYDNRRYIDPTDTREAGGHTQSASFIYKGDVFSLLKDIAM